MSDNIVFVKRYENDEQLFPINEKEIWRYSGFSGVPDQENEELLNLLKTVIGDFENRFSYNVCYRVLPLTWENNLPQLPFDANSSDLARLLDGCDEVVIFAATIGLATDKYIKRFQRTETTKALLAQAYGTERIERLCNVFCKEFSNSLASKNRTCTKRFSPGYGDLPLSLQKGFFLLLDCNRQIGISLNDSLLMTPTKSVTAIFGVKTL